MRASECHRDSVRHVTTIPCSVCDGPVGRRGRIRGDNGRHLA
jgi:hypothetical protein